MEEYNKKLKQRIRKIREGNKLSQQQVADELGISRNAFIAMEIGKTKIINEYYLKFAQKFDKTFASSFVDGYDVKESSTKRLSSQRIDFERQKADIIQHYEIELAEKNEQIAELQKQIVELKRTGQHLNDYIDRYIRAGEVSSAEEND